MPRPRTKTQELTSGQALYVLSRLIKERRISEAQVSRMVLEMQTEIRDLEQRLALLRANAGGSVGSRAGQPRGKHAGVRRVSKNVSPETVASRKVQGEYMGLIRHLRPTERARYKKVARAQGREAAIKAMRLAIGR